MSNINARSRDLSVPGQSGDFTPGSQQHGNRKAERYDRDENLRPIRKLGAKLGTKRAIMIDTRWQKQPGFASKPSAG
jgi:hypothetical protein